MTHEEKKELIHWQHEIDMKAGKEYERKLRHRMADELEKASDGKSVSLEKAKDIVMHQRLFDYDENGKPILPEREVQNANN